MMSVLNADFYTSLKSDKKHHKDNMKESLSLSDTLKLLDLQFLADNSMDLKNITYKQ